MDRLTRREYRIDADGGVEKTICYIGKHAQHGKDLINELSPSALREILERLTAYEDTDLAPEEIQPLKTSAEVQASVMRSLEDVLAAKGEGRILILPCRIGTAVYRLDFNQHDGAWLSPHFFRLQDLDAVGKTIFLARGDAEEALRAWESGTN